MLKDKVGNDWCIGKSIVLSVPIFNEDKISPNLVADCRSLFMTFFSAVFHRTQNEDVSNTETDEAALLNSHNETGTNVEPSE